MLPLFPVLLCLLLFLPAAGICGPDEIVSGLDQQSSVAVTIYNQDLALIRDSRSLDLPAGRQTLAFREVSARIRPETALLAAPGLNVLEQNFEYDLLTPESLLDKYVGKTVKLIKTHPTTGEEAAEEATVLSAGSGTVLRVGDRIEAGVVPGRLVFPDVPENLRDRPTLTMLVDSKEGGKQDAVLSYLTGGLSWKADYVAELGADDASINLSGWVTLTNESGATYQNAKLQLVAGEVNRVRERIQPAMMSMRTLAAAPAMDEGMAEESMFEYHLYTLGRPTTIKEKQSKQVSLLHADSVKANKEFVLQGQNYYYGSAAGNLGQKLKVGVFLELKNSKEAGAGQPLPAGIMRVYKKDSSGTLQFVGEDRIDHTPENEIIRLKLGEAFDVTANKKQTDFKKASWTNGTAYESAYEIELKNAKDEAVTVKVVEPVPGDWQMLEESAAHTKDSAHTAVWRVEIAPKASSTLTWRVRVKY